MRVGRRSGARAQGVEESFSYQVCFGNGDLRGIQLGIHTNNQDHAGTILRQWVYEKMGILLFRAAIAFTNVLSAESQVPS